MQIDSKHTFNVITFGLITRSFQIPNFQGDQVLANGHTSVLIRNSPKEESKDIGKINTNSNQTHKLNHLLVHCRPICEILPIKK